MIAKIDFSKYRILIIAISVSFLWHAFWLFAVKIVDRPSRIEPVKFSQVSFLGPILGQRGFDFRIKPNERSFLEKRYFEHIGSVLGSGGKGDNYIYNGHYEDKNRAYPIEKSMPYLVIQALGENKIEPGSLVR